MAEQKAAARPQPKEEPAPVLARAGESSDPRVHQLLARREIAALNNDGDAVAALTRELAELGVAS